MDIYKVFEDPRVKILEEAEVTWEYGVDDNLEPNQMRLTLLLG